MATNVQNGESWKHNKHVPIPHNEYIYHVLKIYSNKNMLLKQMHTQKSTMTCKFRVKFVMLYIKLWRKCSSVDITLGREASRLRKL